MHRESGGLSITLEVCTECGDVAQIVFIARYPYVLVGAFQRIGVPVEGAELAELTSIRGILRNYGSEIEYGIVGVLGLLLMCITFPYLGIGIIVLPVVLGAALSVSHLIVNRAKIRKRNAKEKEESEASCD